MAKTTTDAADCGCPGAVMNEPVQAFVLLRLRSHPPTLRCSFMKLPLLKNELRNAKRFCRALADWLFEFRRVWITGGAIVLILGVAMLLPICRETALRWAGMLIELLGIGTVVIGLDAKRRLFKLPSFLEHALSWVQRRPKWKPMPIDLAAKVTVGSLTLSGSLGTAILRRGTPDGASLEDRITALEQNLETVQKTQSEIEKRLDHEKTERQQALTTERRERETADGNLRKILEDLGSGGLYLEAMGIAWVMAGVIFATISNDIASFFFDIGPACPNG